MGRGRKPARDRGRHFRSEKVLREKMTFLPNHQPLHRLIHLSFLPTVFYVSLAIHPYVIHTGCFRRGGEELRR